MATMLPLTNNEIKKTKKHSEFICCCISYYSVDICVALHGLISTLLLPLTVRGSIGGQYGILLMNKEEKVGIKLTSIPFGFEVFVVSLFAIAHLMGLYHVLKKTDKGVALYMVFRVFESAIIGAWLLGVLRGSIRSHNMSQDSLIWYCSTSLCVDIGSLILLCYCGRGNPDQPYVGIDWQY